MPVETAADRASFIHEDEHAVTGQYTPSGGSPVSLTGIFDDDYASLGDAEVGTSGSTPSFHVDDADLPPGAAIGDALTVAGVDQVSVDYTVVELMPDGTGFTYIRLQKA